jgi:hypothetical protein
MQTARSHQSLFTSRLRLPLALEILAYHQSPLLKIPIRVPRSPAQFILDTRSASRRERNLNLT